MSWDVLIRHGLIIDGSGRPGAIGDIALGGGRIAALGASLTGDATKIIDADGLAVTPGFIDIKTHSDFTLPLNRLAEAKVRQGVTTEVLKGTLSIPPTVRIAQGERIQVLVARDLDFRSVYTLSAR